MTRLILARHGNTFTAQETPVWVGARTDLPLVEKGLAQAQAVADMLRDANITPETIITGPLLRTKRTAEIIAATLKIPTDTIRIDKRLTEIDYGVWEAKSTAEITAMGDGDKLKAWDKNSVFPSDRQWSPSETQITADVASLLRDAEQKTSVIITSNGILRFFAHAAQNADAFPARKVATGHVCVMEYKDDAWHIVEWGRSPAELSLKA